MSKATAGLYLFFVFIPMLMLGAWAHYRLVQLLLLRDRIASYRTWRWTRGKAVSVNRRGISGFHNPSPWIVTYEFQTDYGKVFQREASLRQSKKPMDVGDTVSVLHDPEIRYHYQNCRLAQ